MTETLTCIPVAAADLTVGERYLVQSKHGMIEGTWEGAIFTGYYWHDISFTGHAFTVPENRPQGILTDHPPQKDCYGRETPFSSTACHPMTDHAKPETPTDTGEAMLREILAQIHDSFGLAKTAAVIRTPGSEPSSIGFGACIAAMRRVSQTGRGNGWLALATLPVPAHEEGEKRPTPKELLDKLGLVVTPRSLELAKDILADLTPPPAVEGERKPFKVEHSKEWWIEKINKYEGDNTVSVESGRLHPDAPYRERFFIDHGMIHDRLTGQHVTTSPDDEIWNGGTIKDCLALLNDLAATPPVPAVESAANDQIEAIRKWHTYAVDGGMDHDGPELMELFKTAWKNEGYLLAEIDRLRTELASAKQHIALHAGDTLSLDNENCQMRSNAEDDAAEIARLRSTRTAVEVTEGPHGLDTADRVCFYEQDFYVLSNFSSFRVQWSGRFFQTSEHAYHYAKFTDHPILRESIHGAPSAHEAFKIAERSKELRRADWDDVKLGIMREIIRAKARQHEYVSRKLLATGDRQLVENSWRDDYWGWGPNRDGQNWLGKLWMELRTELRAALAAQEK